MVNPTDISGGREPTMWQRRVGLLAVLLSSSALYFIEHIGSVLDSFIRLAEDGSPVLWTTPFLIGAGRLAGSFWYVWIAVILAFYLLWLSKKANRLLWFNAVFSIAFPALLWFVINACLCQCDMVLHMFRGR